MTDSVQTLSALYYCPTCGAELTSSGNKNERIKCHNCRYHEHPQSGQIVSLLGRTLGKYAKAKQVDIAKIHGIELDIEEALLPTGLLPLLVTRIDKSHMLTGLHAYRGLYFPLQAIEDRNSLIKYRVIYDSEFPVSLHIPALLLVDSFEELFHLTHANNKSKYTDYVDFDIVLSLIKTQNMNLLSTQKNSFSLGNEVISAIEDLLKKQHQIESIKPGQSQRPA